jgi:hypothetical protein
MSRMNELYCDIELMLEQGDSPLKIAQYLQVPIKWVYEVSESPDEELSPFKTINS